MNTHFFWLRRDGLSDRRVATLKDRDFNSFFWLLMMINEQGSPLNDQHVADELAMTLRRAKLLKQRLMKAKLIDAHWQLTHVDWFITGTDGGDGVQPECLTDQSGCVNTQGATL